MSYFGKFYLTGPEAQQAADWIFSARMDGEEGKTVYTCMLNDQAGIEADLRSTPRELQFIPVPSVAECAHEIWDVEVTAVDQFSGINDSRVKLQYS